MKKTLFFTSIVMSSAWMFGQNCSKPFISEYVEGLNNNKAIEIYNPTTQEIDMTGYFLQRYDNGSSTATAEGQTQATTIQLKGKIPPKGVIVYVIDLRDPAGEGQTAPVWDSLQMKANEFLGGKYEVNKTMFWNGDDALLLGKGSSTNPDKGEVMDIFGRIGERPTEGWSTVAPYNNSSGDINDVPVTKDHSMIRKANIQKGYTPTPPFPVWNPLEEWDSIPPIYYQFKENGDTLRDSQGKPRKFGNWGTLGSHECTCKDSTNAGSGGKASVSEINWDDVQLYPNPSKGTVFVTGANDITTIQVYNTLGQEVHSVNNDNHAIVSLTLKEKTGVYLVRFKHRNGSTSTKRLIVK